jgi:beta-glucosidase
MKQDSGFPPLGVGMPASLTSPHEIVNAKDPTSKQTILDGAIEGHVLVKNENNILPLKSPQLLSLFGYSAKAYDTNTGNPQWLFGYGGFNDSDFEAFLTGFRGGHSPATAPGGNLICGGGSGANAPPYVNSPFDALQERAWKDNTALLWDFRNPGADGPVDPQSDACLVFINAFATEGADRPNLADDYSDRLVINVSSSPQRITIFSPLYRSPTSARTLLSSSIMLEFALSMPGSTIPT